MEFLITSLYFVLRKLKTVSCKQIYFSSLKNYSVVAYEDLKNLKFPDYEIFIKWRYTYDVHQNCQIIKTSYLLVQLCPRFFHLRKAWTSNFKRIPTSSNDNQAIKRKHNPRMTIIFYQAFLSGRLSFSASTHY